MTAHHALAVVFTLLLASCDASSFGLEDLRFACESDEQCSPGFVCRGECVREDSVVDVDAGGLDAGTEEIDAGTSALRFSSLPVTVRAGSCLMVRLEAQVSQAVKLDVSPAGAAFFASDDKCASMLTRTEVSGQTDVYLKLLSGGRVTMTATGDVDTATALINVTPAVRRGVCSLPARGPPLPDGGLGAPGTTRTCSVSPAVTDLSSSFTIAQSVTTGLQLGGAATVDCSLTSASTLQCTRVQDSDAVDIRFQIAELPNGLRSWSIAADCRVPIPLDGGVNWDSAFILHSRTGSSTYFDDDDTPVATPDGGFVVLEPPRCTSATLQAVQWNGLEVTRGTIDAGASLSQTALASGLKPASANTALITQTYTPDGIHDVCAVMVRGSMPSSSSIELSRGAGDTTCMSSPFPSVAWERIDFGARAQVQQHTVRLETPMLARAVTISPVDLSRTIVFASNQSVAGQGAGETGLADPRLYTAGTATFELTSGNTVTVTRGEGSAASVFTFYVVELNP